MARSDIVSKETLNLILLLDNSYSMKDARISQLNNAIPTLKNNLIQVAEENNVDIKLRIISFSDMPEWKVGTITEGEDIKSVVWTDLKENNDTFTDLAILEANKALKKEYLGSHALRPIVILITDGNCNLNRHDKYLRAIEEMKKSLSGNSGKDKVTRIAIGVEDYNIDELEEFASKGILNESDDESSQELEPLVFKIDKASDISKVINWVAETSLFSSINADEGPIVMYNPEWDEYDE